MKKLLLALPLLAGCQDKPIAQAARLSGVNELVQVGEYLFSTSTDKDELRVLDLAPESVQGRQFKLAPNPLEALAVPVVPRPVGLVRDVSYEPTTVKVTLDGVDGGIDLPMPDGTTVFVTDGSDLVIPEAIEVGGPYVYAVAAGGLEISVVDGTNDLDLPADAGVGSRTNLREVKRLVAPAPVTAMNAVRRADGTSRLAYATWDGSRALLVTVDLPGVEAIEATPLSAIEGRTRVADALFDEVISALLFLSDERLVVATRQDRGAKGRTFVFDLQTLATRALDFPGPVRMLATHPSVYAGNRVKGRGSRIYGVLAEEACGNPGCGGIVAVDTATGARSLDQGGQPMFTLTVGDALVQGLAIGRSVNLAQPTGPSQWAALPIPLLGVATSSTGTLVFFDADGLTQLDFDGSGPRATQVRMEYPPTPDKPNGTVETYVAGPIKDDPETPEVNEGPRFAAGAVVSETVLVIFQSEIPGLINLPTAEADGLRFPLPAGAAANAKVGDRVLLFAGEAACGEAPVESVDADAVVVADLPQACPGRSRFTVRAGPQAPYVVLGSTSGYMGRTGPNRTFSFARPYYHHPAGFDPSRPAVQFDLGEGDPNMPRDGRWVLEVADAWAPYVSTVDSSAGCSPNLPGTPVIDVRIHRLFVAYASANGIVEVDPTVAHRGALSRNVYCYR